MLAAVALVVAAACTSQTTVAPTSIGASSTTTTTVAATTSALPPTSATRPTTTAVTTATTVPASTTTAVATSTTVGCPAAGTLADTSVDFPQKMSRLVGVDIRTGAHPCFERVVVELASFDPAFPATAASMPGYWVRYADRPIMESPIGEPVEVLGDAVLLASVYVWMGDMEGNGYAGSRDIRPTNVRHILQLRQIENVLNPQEVAITHLEPRVVGHREIAHGVR